MVIGVLRVAVMWLVVHSALATERSTEILLVIGRVLVHVGCVVRAVVVRVALVRVSTVLALAMGLLVQMLPLLGLRLSTGLLLGTGCRVRRAMSALLSLTIPRLSLWGVLVRKWRGNNSFRGNIRGRWRFRKKAPKRIFKCRDRAPYLLGLGCRESRVTSSSKSAASSLL